MCTYCTPASRAHCSPRFSNRTPWPRCSGSTHQNSSVAVDSPVNGCSNTSSPIIPTTVPSSCSDTNTVPTSAARSSPIVLAMAGGLMGSRSRYTLSRRKRSPISTRRGMSSDVAARITCGHCGNGESRDSNRAVWRGISSTRRNCAAGTELVPLTHPGRSGILFCLFMDVQKSFEAIGARIKLRPRQSSYALDVRRDKAGEYFDLSVATDAPEFQVLQAVPDDRHLLLYARDGQRYLCGHDERHWF